MSTCNDGFQELQALQQQHQETLERAAKIESEINRRQHGPDAVTGDADARVMNRALDELVARWDGEQMRNWVETAMETRQRTHIASDAGQPNNFSQLLKSANIEDAKDYAKVSKLLLEIGDKLNPQAFKFVHETMGTEYVADQMLKAYGELVGTQQLGLLLANDVAPFASLVERMTRLRVAASGFRQTFTDEIRRIQKYRQKTSAPVPQEMRARLFDAWRKALVTERHVDLARSRTGQTLRSLQDGLPDLPALKAQLESGEIFAPDPAMVEATLGIKPGDHQAGSPFAEIVQAIDDTDATRGAEKLRQLGLNIALEGTNPKARLEGMDLFNSQMKLGNLLAKDAQLTNINTQAVANGGSNVAMALVGPLRQTFENIGTLTPYGSRFSREAWNQGFASSWQGTKMAMDVVRTSGKEVFLDAFFDGRTVFAGNKDTFGKTLAANDQVALQMQGLLDQPYGRGWMMNPINWGIQRNKIHAALRLFLFEKSGGSIPLQPGLRLLSAVDNVAGLYHHAFKVRNDLEVRVRRDGVQMGLLDQQSMDDWIDTEFSKSFYGLEPRESDVKAYRRENGYGGEISDDQIKEEIISKRIGDTYGGPTLGTPESIAAEQYSRELRFQNEPGDLRPDSHRSRFATDAYESVQRFRQNWLADMVFPYVQAPLMGTLLDFTTMGITPAIDTVSMWMHPGGFTPAQKARVKANWVVAGTMWASFFALDSQGLIIGNGPVDPKERQEWEAGLKARGLVPNSIAGVPLLGGIPFISSLFLAKDLKEAFIYGTYSKLDQQTALMGMMQVLTGQLMRQTSLGQFRQMAEILMNPSKTNVQRQAGDFAGYIGSGQVPGIGLIRDAGRQFAIGRDSYYRDGLPTAADKQIPSNPWDETLQKLKGLARSTGGLAYGINGARRETDWLGSRINLPFGMRYIDAMSHRFFPQLWPNDKVYAELDAQNMLNPPRALMSGELDGVAMSDDLQKEYNTAFSTLKGDSFVGRMAQSGKKPSFTVAMPIRIDLPSGVTYEKSVRGATVQVGPFLEEHIRGKTAVEAYRSVINSPLYQRMQDLPGTTGDMSVSDMTPAQRRGQAAQVLLRAVQSYYELRAHDALINSQSPDALDWKDRRKTAFVSRQSQAAERLQGLREAVGGN